MSGSSSGEHPVTSGGIDSREDRELLRKQVLYLYRANPWVSTDKPEALCQALANYDAVVSA